MAQQFRVSSPRCAKFRKVYACWSCLWGKMYGLFKEISGRTEFGWFAQNLKVMRHIQQLLWKARTMNELLCSPEATTTNVPTPTVSQDDAWLLCPFCPFQFLDVQINSPHFQMPPFLHEPNPVKLCVGCIERGHVGEQLPLTLQCSLNPLDYASWTSMAFRIHLPTLLPQSLNIQLYTPDSQSGSLSNVSQFLPRNRSLVIFMFSFRHPRLLKTIPRFASFEPSLVNCVFLLFFVFQ